MIHYLGKFADESVFYGHISYNSTEKSKADACRMVLEEPQHCDRFNLLHAIRKISRLLYKAALCAV